MAAVRLLNGYWHPMPPHPGHLALPDLLKVGNVFPTSRSEPFRTVRLSGKLGGQPPFRRLAESRNPRVLDAIDETHHMCLR